MRCPSISLQLINPASVRTRLPLRVSLAQIRAIQKQPTGASVVLLLELPEHQAGEELWLGELVWAIDVGVVAERL
jgi:hypothetical protein